MKKKIIIISIVLFFSFMFVFFMTMFDFCRQQYVELRILDVEILEINNKSYVFVNIDVSTIEKTFPSSYLLITERSISHDIDEINFTIVASYACLSPEVKAIPSSTIMLSDAFFATGKNLITTGKSRRHIFTIKKIKDKDNIRLEVEKR